MGEHVQDALQPGFGLRCSPLEKLLPGQRAHGDLTGVADPHEPEEQVGDEVALGGAEEPVGVFGEGTEGRIGKCVPSEESGFRAAHAEQLGVGALEPGDQPEKKLPCRRPGERVLGQGHGDQGA